MEPLGSSPHEPDAGTQKDSPAPKCQSRDTPYYDNKSARAAQYIGYLVRVDCIDLTECETLDDVERAMDNMSYCYETVWVKKEDIQGLGPE